MANRKKSNTTKVGLNTIPASLTVSNPNEYPLVYSEDAWDVVESGSSLEGVLGNEGQYDQHVINEALAEGLDECGEHQQNLKVTDYVG